MLDRFSDMIQDYRDAFDVTAYDRNFTTTQDLWHWLLTQPSLQLKGAKLSVDFFPTSESQDGTSDRAHYLPESMNWRSGNCVRRILSKISAWHFELEVPGSSCPVREHHSAVNTDTDRFIVKLSHCTSPCDKGIEYASVWLQIYHPRCCTDGPFDDTNMCLKTYCPQHQGTDRKWVLPKSLSIKKTGVLRDSFIVSELFFSQIAPRLSLHKLCAFPPSNELQSVLQQQYPHFKCFLGSEFYSCMHCHTVMLSWQNVSDDIFEYQCVKCCTEAEPPDDSAPPESVFDNNYEVEDHGPEVFASEGCMYIRLIKGIKDGELQTVTKQLCNFEFVRLVFTENFDEVFQKNSCMWVHIRRAAASADEVSARAIDPSGASSNTDGALCVYRRPARCSSCMQQSTGTAGCICACRLTFRT